MSQLVSIKKNICLKLIYVLTVEKVNYLWVVIYGNEWLFISKKKMFLGNILDKVPFPFVYLSVIKVMTKRPVIYKIV